MAVRPWIKLKTATKKPLALYQFYHYFWNLDHKQLYNNPKNVEIMYYLKYKLLSLYLGT
jgi:hypothetical protein